MSKEQIIELLASLGSEDAASQYFKGWDNAITAAIDAIQVNWQT